jgi:hypothetical protein
MLRLPPELHARLVRLAEQEHRSLTAEVTHLLEEAVGRAERGLRERELRQQGLRELPSVAEGEGPPYRPRGAGEEADGADPD